MHRRELLLAVLATANGRPFHPAQIQKAIFLIEENLPGLINQGAGYNFVPYNYGPFDRGVYIEAENLQAEGAAIIASPNGRWNTYAASGLGMHRGRDILNRIDARSRNYIERIVEWVLAQSFGSLVRAIYDAYPPMRANSIFQG